MIRNNNEQPVQRQHGLQVYYLSPMVYYEQPVQRQHGLQVYYLSPMVYYEQPVQRQHGLQVYYLSPMLYYWSLRQEITSYSAPKEFGS